MNNQAGFKWDNETYPAVYLFIPKFKVTENISRESNTIFDQNMKCFKSQKWLKGRFEM